MREQGRFKEQLRQFRGKMEEMQDKLNAVQNDIFKANESMDQFKLQMNWNQVGRPPPPSIARSLTHSLIHSLTHSLTSTDMHVCVW